MTNNLKDFLDSKSKFPGLYRDGLEVQINVAEDNGERHKKGFIDNTTGEYWYNYRLCSSNYPDYDIPTHAFSIGVTGWNYKTKCSEFVGFDFDSINGHKKGLTDNQIGDIIEQAKKVPWATIRRSTSGNGLHIYVFFASPIPTPDRKSHSLLAQFILSQLSALVNFDFKAHVDCAGGVLWVWSRKGNKPKSFQCLQSGVPLSKVPDGWKDTALKDKVKKFSFNIKHTKLSHSQRELIEWFNKQNDPEARNHLGNHYPGATWWWDAELNMLVCHTHDLSRAHKELNCKGIFKTIATGKDCPNDQNCFLYPIRNDAWIVRRHGSNTKEAETWRKDKSGWTYCFFNKHPSLSDLSRTFLGNLSSKSEYVFNGNTIGDVLNYISLEQVAIPEGLRSRQFRLKQLKQKSKLSIVTDRLTGEPDLEGWINNPKSYEKVIDIAVEDREVVAPDDLIRHVISDGKGSGWFIKVKDNWVDQEKGNIRDALLAMGHQPNIINEIFGKCILNPWTLVSYPFETEYPGDRVWNKLSPRLLYDPIEGKHPTWDLMFDHLGSSLTPAVLENRWCKLYSVNSGADYFKLWTASIFQYPLEPLPYIFLYGPQLSGKSSFHEALDLLMINGVCNAGNALESNDGFNKEIAGNVVCYVEEIDLRRSKGAYNKIKQWVTAKKITIHGKGETPFTINNTTHWLHCANSSGFCPIDHGDTRIMMVFVPKPKLVLTKSDMMEKLQEEAPAFLYTMLNLDIPPASDRLRIPVIETEDKKEEQTLTANEVIKFINEKVKLVPGHKIRFKDFCARFQSWVSNPALWSDNKQIAASIPLTDDMPIKGRHNNNEVWLGNCSFDMDAEPEMFQWVLQNGRLTKESV